MADIENIIAEYRNASRPIREVRKFRKLRKFWTGEEDGCFSHSWDNPTGATRICKVCGRVEVMSHL